MNELQPTIEKTVETIQRCVTEWAGTAGIELDPVWLEARCQKEAESWIADGFTEQDYQAGWNCWTDRLAQPFTERIRGLESAVAESIVKIARFATADDELAKTTPRRAGWAHGAPDSLMW